MPREQPVKANDIGARSTARGAARSTDDFVIVKIMAGATEKGTAARYSARKDGLRESNMLSVGVFAPVVRLYS